MNGFEIYNFDFYAIIDDYSTNIKYTDKKTYKTINECIESGEKLRKKLKLNKKSCKITWNIV